MPVCPWCQADVTDPRFPCGGCGRRPKDHVSQLAHEPAGGGGSYGELELADAVAAPEVPDLDFGPRKAPVRSRPVAPAPALPEDAPSAGAHEVPSFAPPPMKPAVRKATPGAPPSVGASSFDDMDMMSNDIGSIDLAGESPSASPAPRPIEPASPVPRQTPLLAEDGGKEAALRLSDFGNPPSQWWRAPLYAYRVTMRQMELRRELLTRRADFAKAQDAVDDALVAFAERGRKQITTNEAYSKLLVGVIASEHALRERDGALAAETDAHAQKLAVFDGRIGEHDADLAGARAELKAYDDVFQRADAIRQRADAKVKRVDIELRAAVTRASPAGVPGGAAVSEEVQAAVAARTAEREARLSELAQAMPAVTEATQNLTTARRKATTIEQKVLAIKNERAAVEAGFRKRGAAHGAEVARAQKDVRAAMALLGRALAGDQQTFGAEWADDRKALAALEKTAASRDDDVMLHVMALDAHDHAKVRTGVGMAVAAIGLLVVLALLPLAFRTSSPPPPAPTTVNLSG